MKKTFLLQLPIYYLIVVVVMYFLQDLMLYPASKMSQAETEKQAEQNQLRLWPNEKNYQGFLSENVPSVPKGTILVFHGNAGTALDRIHYVRALEPLGYRVILLEYPGYGARSGKPSEQAFVEDLVAATKQASEEFGKPLFFLGTSLGAGVASATIGEGSVIIDGVALITPWDSLTNLAQSMYPFLPVKWLMRDQYESTTHLSQYKGPIAVAIAERDEIVPARFGHKLYDALPHPKRLWVFPGAAHNSWPAHPQEPWWNELMQFLHSNN